MCPARDVGWNSREGILEKRQKGVMRALTSYSLILRVGSDQEVFELYGSNNVLEISRRDGSGGWVRRPDPTRPDPRVLTPRASLFFFFVNG